MIAFWNRREVYVGASMKEFNSILDALAAAEVKYTFRTVSHTQLNRLAGRVGENLQNNIMYYIYVHKKDAEKAAGLLD